MNVRKNKQVKEISKKESRQEKRKNIKNERLFWGFLIACSIFNF